MRYFAVLCSYRDAPGGGDVNVEKDFPTMEDRVQFLRERLAEFKATLELSKQLYGDQPTEAQSSHLTELEGTIHQIEDTLVFVDEAHTATPAQVATALIDVIRVGSPRFEGDAIQKAINTLAWNTLWCLNALQPLRDAMRRAMKRQGTKFGHPDQLEELVDHFVTTAPNPDWMLPKLNLQQALVA